MNEVLVNIWTTQPKKWAAKFRDAKPLPNQSDLLDRLTYNSETGELTWKERPRSMFPNDHFYNNWNAKHAGQPAFMKINNSGYRKGRVCGDQFSAHRVILKMVTGEDPECVDHINGDRLDNRLKNLRSVSRSVNARNTPRLNGGKYGTANGNG